MAAKTGLSYWQVASLRETCIDLSLCSKDCERLRTFTILLMRDGTPFEHAEARAVRILEKANGEVPQETGGGGGDQVRSD